jgi:DNA-binding GntR family transcriptional regulator
MANMTTLKPIASRPASLTEMVQDAIRDAIVSRRLSPGDRITEAALAAQLEVSKTPVREALLKLEYIGLIESDGGRGGRIITPSHDSIRSAYEVRLGLETQAARIVSGMPDAGAEARTDAENCLAAAEQSDRAGFREHDRRFHLSLARATRNQLLERLIHDSFDLTWTLRDRDVPITDDSLTCAQQHMDVVRAIEAQDAQKAEDAMRGHIQMVQDLVLAAFDSQGDASGVPSIR